MKTMLVTGFLALAMMIASCGNGNNNANNNAADSSSTSYSDTTRMNSAPTDTTRMSDTAISHRDTSGKQH